MHMEWISPSPEIRRCLTGTLIVEPLNVEQLIVEQIEPFAYDQYQRGQLQKTDGIHGPE